MSVFTPESGCSAERESVGINSRIQEFNCERAVTYRIVLSAYLFKVQPRNAQILFFENPRRGGAAPRDKEIQNLRARVGAGAVLGRCRAGTIAGRRRNAYCRSVGAGGMTACVLAPSATVPQPGRDSINGDVDSLHELVVSFSAARFCAAMGLPTPLAEPMTDAWTTDGLPP